MKKTIIITGASSGLGAALAEEYSRGKNNLFLFARSKERLKKIADICKANGANVTKIIADVADQSAMQQNLDKISSKHKVDIVIACAGVSAGTLNGPETPEQANKIFNVNLNGALNSVMPLIPHMIKNKSGNIAIISSMAGMIGLSSAPSYSASKAAVRVFSDALNGYLKSYNIHVSNVIPGYIKTPMTDVNTFPMPFMIDAEKAAKKIISGIEKNKGVIAFPLIMYFFMKFLNLLPSSLMSYINSKLPGKPAFEKNDLR